MSLENPFQDPLRFERRVPECAMVIFGANGDLTKRKLLPALYRLAYERRLDAGFAVLGISRTPMSDDQFREKMLASVKEFLEDSPFDADVWTAFAQGLFYMAGDIENPFGHDLASARKLSDELHKAFEESEVYRIDHYLGKETVQNILAFRFGNGIFEPLWNRRYVNHVQITAAESIGVENRGAYYQEAGALRDMIQNHLSQVMATIAMEPSATFRPNSVRDERSKLLRSIRVMKPDEVLQNTVSGQYGPAHIGGADVPGFRQEQGVKPDAQTDTYAAVTFFVDNWRWAGVPFYLRSGKRLPKRVTEIAIQFNAAPLAIFNGEETTTAPNLLILRIQPEEGISLKFLSKRPGTGMKLRPVSMDFNYGSSFGERSPSAYETLLLDVIIGDATLYTRQDMVEASWAVVDAVQHVWHETKFDFPNYAAGSWGPQAADDMLARRGHVWRQP